MIRYAAALAVIPVAGPALADPLQDPVRDRVLAGMKVATPDIAFTQTTRIEQSGEPARDIVTRYDPRAAVEARWSVVRVDGRAPTAKESADILKGANKAPLPSYTRLARWFGGPATRVAETPGSVTYRFNALPRGVVQIAGHDASADTIADAVVNTAGRTPYVERVRFASSKPFRIMMVAKVERYVVGATYAPIADGRVFPSGSDSEMGGSMLGKAGTLSTRTRYSEIHGAR